MTGRSGRSAPRAVAVALAAANLPLVVRPDDVLALLGSGSGSARPPRWLVRLLGSRVLLQELGVLAAPTRRAVLAGVAVDGLHAASMVLAAVAWPMYRRAAAISGAAAAVSAVLGSATAPPAARRLP